MASGKIIFEFLDEKIPNMLCRKTAKLKSRFSRNDHYLSIALNVRYGVTENLKKMCRKYGFPYFY